MMKHHVAPKPACAPVPQFERLNFFYGQMLSAADFRSEQDYFREKIKLHNRCLHGWGVVCGLEVEPAPVDPCCVPATEEEKKRICRELEKIEDQIAEIAEKLAAGPSDEEAEKLKEQLEELRGRREELRRRKEELCLDDEKPDPCADDRHRIGVIIHCGIALDCCGNEIVLRDRIEVNLWTLLSGTDRRRLLERRCADIWLSICYCAEPSHPSRPVLPDSCGALADCSFGRTRDSFRLEASLERPPEDERCEPCCEPCEVHCVLLARVRWDPQDEDAPVAVDNSVRRPLGRYHPTAITGISWVHGAVYSSDEAKQVLGTEDDGPRTDGIEIRFSRPVYADTLRPGVVDLLRIQGGRGLRGVISHIEGAYVGLDPDGDGCVTRVFYRDESGETINRGDRLMLIVRADFILDKCCRPVDGNHVGGRVPLIEGYAPPAEAAEEEWGGKRENHKGKDYRDEDYRQQRPRDRYDDGDDRIPRHEPPTSCPVPPDGTGVWRSGNGVVGGTFESWIFVD